MARERQLLLGSKDPRWNPAGLRFKVGQDQLELPHLHVTEISSSARKPAVLPKSTINPLPVKGHIGEHIDMEELQHGTHKS